MKRALALKFRSSVRPHVTSKVDLRYPISVRLLHRPLARAFVVVGGGVGADDVLRPDDDDRIVVDGASSSLRRDDDDERVGSGRGKGGSGSAGRRRQREPSSTLHEGEALVQRLLVRIIDRKLESGRERKEGKEVGEREQRETEGGNGIEEGRKKKTG